MCGQSLQSTEGEAFHHEPSKAAGIPGKQGQRNLNLECFQFRTVENRSTYFTSYPVSAVLLLKYQWIDIYLCELSRSAQSVMGTVNTKETLKSEECTDEPHW